MLYSRWIFTLYIGFRRVENCCQLVVYVHLLLHYGRWRCRRGISPSSVGFISYVQEDEYNDSRYTGARGSLFGDNGVVLGVGVAMGIGAWVLGEVSRPTMQPGATTQWTP